jgi:hypothetical protein
VVNSVNLISATISGFEPDVVFHVLGGSARCAVGPSGCRADQPMTRQECGGPTAHKGLKSGDPKVVGFQGPGRVIA